MNAFGGAGRPGPERPDEDELAHLVALHSLPGMGPLRLAALLEGRSARDGWALVAADRVPREVRALGLGARVARDWSVTARQLVPAELLATRAGIEVVVAADERYPARLVGDPEAPVLLFARGDVGAAHVPLVAIVGTRRATPYGVKVARRFGRELSEAGVSVVSGLAAGIDAAAHAGALECRGATPVGVVGSGPDVVYPRRNRWLWDSIAARGVLLGEAPLGAPPERWRFPARNRIVAALASVVVVVESHIAGGSLITAEQAAVRCREVLAVPGSVLSPASTGANALLAAGVGPARDTQDILVALGLGGSSTRLPVVEERPADPDQASVLDALGWEPARLDELAMRTGLALGRLAAAIDGLERSGIVERARGVVLRAR
ncbi:MAG: DNA-protecting protein DprA [Acidimicrobiia bacterium]|nr:DNA-protecting protein DprA [Acidimicrobiia bacterium]